MSRDDLFATPPAPETASGEPADAQSPRHMPLAARMRPRNLSEYAGQSHILGPGQLLRRAIEADRIQSLIFYGPPGTGKTSLAQIIARQTRSKFERLSGVESNVADMRRVLAAAANRLANTGQPTILFIDEIHRFNKSQQDVLLPDVEKAASSASSAPPRTIRFSSSIRRSSPARKSSSCARFRNRSFTISCCALSLKASAASVT